VLLELAEAFLRRPTDVAVPGRSRVQAADQAVALGAPSGLFRVYRWLQMEHETAVSLATPPPPVNGDLHLAAVRARMKGATRDAVEKQERLASLPDWKHTELYYLARLYLEAGQPRRAITALHRLQRTYPAVSGMAAFVHSYPRSFYRLGQAHELAGEHSEALAAYERFLDLWRDADPELKELQDGRAQAARLRLATR
jgi:tetratricopeptide (TPR) repeat protein